MEITVMSLPLVLVRIFSTEVESLELITWRFQLNGGFLGSKGLLSHYVPLKVDTT